MYTNLPLVTPKGVRKESRYFALRNKKEEFESGINPREQEKRNIIVISSPENDRSRSRSKQRSEQSSISIREVPPAEL